MSLPTPIATAAGLRLAVAALADAGDPRLLPIAHAIQDWLEASPGEDAPTLDTTLGLAPTWRSDLRRAERDAALLRLAGQYFRGLTGRAAAHAVAEAIHRYETTSWPRDRRAGRRPDGLNGAAHDVLTRGEVPGEERLRQLFRAGNAPPVRTTQPGNDIHPDTGDHADGRIPENA